MEVELFPKEEECVEKADEPIAVTKTGIIKDDEEYIEEWFRICEIIMKKKPKK